MVQLVLQSVLQWWLTEIQFHARLVSLLAASLKFWATNLLHATHLQRPRSPRYLLEFSDQFFLSFVARRILARSCQFAVADPPRRAPISSRGGSPTGTRRQTDTPPTLDPPQIGNPDSFEKRITISSYILGLIPLSVHSRDERASRLHDERPSPADSTATLT